MKRSSFSGAARVLFEVRSEDPTVVDREVLWTDGFSHREQKNGTRVAATLYLVEVWLLALYVAVALVITLVLLIA